MTFHHQTSAAKSASSVLTAPVFKRSLVASMVVLAALGMSACGNKEKKAGQSVVVVNGEEITQHQINDELQRVPPAQHAAASKQLMEQLIDRQVLLDAAVKDKLDRSATVMQAVERAKVTIIAQSYMQKKLSALPKPTKSEIEEYYTKNPVFFGERKVFDMKQLQMAAKDVTDDVKKMLDTAKNLDEVAAFLTEKKVVFGRGQVSRSSSDLPPQMTEKLVSMPREQLFMVNEGGSSTLLQVVEIKPAAVTLAVASPQIEQFLINKKNKEFADGEIKRLRAAAKIEYLPGAPKDVAKPAASAAASAAAPAAASPAAAPAAASASSAP